VRKIRLARPAEAPAPPPITREHAANGDNGDNDGAASAAPGGADIPELLERMRHGDRTAAALFVTRYGGRLRRRIRGKLSPSMRRIFDSQEILSTVGRRLDLYVRSGRLEADSVDRLWALLLRMTEHAVIDKGRVFRRLRRIEDEDSPFAHQLVQRLRDADEKRSDGSELEIEQAIGLFDESVDRQILSMWLVGSPLSEIAPLVEMSPYAARRRWYKIKDTLQRRYAAEAGG
jgi:hypothetical protein